MFKAALPGLIIKENWHGLLIHDSRTARVRSLVDATCDRYIIKLSYSLALALDCLTRGQAMIRRGPAIGFNVLPGDGFRRSILKESTKNISTVCDNRA